MTALSGRVLPTSVLLLALLAGTGVRGQVAPAESDSISGSGGGEELVERARLQTELAEYEDAQGSYLAGIDRLIEANGEYSPTLIEPLEAITVLQQAQHISQRNFGLLNLEQTALLDEMSRAYLAIGDTVEAQNIQRRRLTLAQRRFGEDDPRVIPFHNQLADYYDLSRMRVHARDQYEAVLAVQRENFGESDGRLLIPLSELVRIDIQLGDPSAARRRLLRVLESSENATPLEIANALAILGDWELARRRVEAALPYYRDAYATLAAEDPVAAAEYFEAPRFVDFVPPPSPVDLRGNEAPYAWGSITARFRVSAEGAASDIAIVEATPRGLMDSAYAQRLASASFRPRLLDGEPAETSGITYRHEFRYFIETQQP